MLTCMYAHRKIKVQTFSEPKTQIFSETKNSYLGKMRIQMSYISAIGRKDSGSSLKVFYCFVLSLSHPSVSFPLLFVTK